MVGVKRKKGCVRCYDIKYNVYPMKDYKTGKIEYVCGKCLTSDERKEINILIQRAYQGGKGL